MDPFERLRAADPMQGVDPNMSEIRAEVMSHVGRRRGVPALAVAAALVLVAGTAGVFAGRATAPAQDVASLPVIPSAGQSANNAMPTSGSAMPTSGEAKDSSAARGGYFWGARTVLKPTSAITNVAGTAKAYRFIARDVDAKALALRLADFVGAEGDLRTDQAYYSIGEQDGTSPVVWVSDDALVSFSASDNSKSPWQCMKSEPSSGGATSEECTQPAFKAPSIADATTQAKAAFTTIGLNLEDVQFTASADNVNVNVQAWRVVEGKRVALNWYADVSERGVYALNGNAATLEELPEYPILGARDTALRTSDPRWTEMTPFMVSAAVGNAANDGVSVGVPAAQSSTPPGMLIKGNRPVIPVYTNIVSVGSASQGLMQMWINEQTFLLPSWEFRDTAGNTWAMLAIADEYIDYRETR